MDKKLENPELVLKTIKALEVEEKKEEMVLAMVQAQYTSGFNDGTRYVTELLSMAPEERKINIMQKIESYHKKLKKKII